MRIRVHDILLNTSYILLDKEDQYLEGDYNKTFYWLKICCRTLTSPDPLEYNYELTKHQYQNKDMIDNIYTKILKEGYYDFDAEYGEKA